MKLICAVISLLLIIATPLGFYWIMKKKAHIRFQPFQVTSGIVVFFLMKSVVINFVYELLLLIPGMDNLTKSSIMTGACSIISGAILIFASYWLINRFYFQKRMDLSGAVNVSLGALLTEILLNTLMPALSNLIYLIQSISGQLVDNLVNESLSLEQAESIIEMYSSYSAEYYLYYGLVTVGLLLAYFLTGYLFVLWNKKELKEAALLIAGVIVSYTAAFYLINPLNVNFTSLLILVVLLVEGLLTCQLMKQYG
jgi:hypothetical protein